MENLKITFYMDGTGVVVYPDNPIHLDSLMTFVLSEMSNNENVVTRESQPDDFDLPLEKWNIQNEWGWHASALFPQVKGETVLYWRKRFRQNESAGMFSLKPNLQSGAYREYNTPIPIILCSEIISYARGHKNKISDIIKNVKYIGQKRSYGRGRVIDFTIKKIKEDYSLIRNDKSQRFLPLKEGIKFIRVRPPYWNIVDRVKACNVGDIYSFTKKSDYNV
jgi:hypothetical protein